MIENSGTQRDANCVECVRMFSTVLPEWGTDICEDCVQAMTFQTSRSEEVVPVEPQIPVPILNPVSSLSDDNKHIHSVPGATIILPDQHTTIQNDSEIELVIASPVICCCCGCGIDVSGSHHYCSVTGKQVTHLFIHTNILWSISKP